MNTGAEIAAWIVVGAAAGWLAGRIIGTGAQRGAPVEVFIGVLGALVVGFITRGMLANLGYEDLGVAGVAGALFGACVVVFGWHGFSYPQGVKREAIEKENQDADRGSARGNNASRAREMGREAG